MKHPMAHRLSLHFLLPAVLLLLGMLGLSACSEEVNPFIGTELPYSIWGQINPDADTQAVRVFLIDDVLQLVSPDPLDAMVSIVNVDNTTRYVLRDSVIQLRSGDYRHIFWAPFSVNHNETYRIEVERSDGQLSRSAEVRVPAPVSLDVLPANINATSDLIQSVAINGDPPAMPRIDVKYNSYSVSGSLVTLAENPVTISYANQPQVRNGQLTLDLDLRRDFELVREDFDEKSIPGFICLEDIDIDVHVGNVEWQSPTGEFDPNFLVEPGSLTNIENGFGFFGAGFVQSQVVIPPSVLQVRAGFFDCVGSN